MEECEKKLTELILQMKAEIAALRSGAVTEYPNGVSPKKKQLAAYLRENPDVSSNLWSPENQRYYDEIREEFNGTEDTEEYREGCT